VTPDAERFGSGTSGERSAERLAATGRDLDDVPHADARQDESSGRNGPDANRPPAAIGEHDVDREPHAECMDRPASRQHEGGPRVERVAVEQPARALASGRRDEEEPRVEALASDQSTVAMTTDTACGVIQDRVTRKSATSHA
jgi:hypothetical protein